MWNGYGGMNMGGGIGMILVVLFWVLLIVAAVWVIVLLSKKAKSDQPGSSSESALEILKKRYARGELNKEEFEQKKHDLQG